VSEVRSAAKESITGDDAELLSVDGTGGFIISVKVIEETCASDKSSLARAWPMKPPAPVMRILMLIVSVADDVQER
jgi:hypothetical protein